MTNQGADPDRAAEQLTAMLADLADDPDAPASTVTARSVLEAARAAALQQPTESIADPVQESAAQTRRQPAETGSSSVADLQQFGARAEAARTKAQRRRTALFSLAAAAAVAAIAAVLIPVAITGNSGTTSANSAREAPVAAAAPSTAAAAGSAQQSAAGSAAAGAADANAAPELATGSESRTPDDSALTSDVPTGASANALNDADSCWPPLPDAAAVALTAVLPPGAFAPPSPLTADCGTNPIAGAALVGTDTAVALDVRVTAAEPGRCELGGAEVAVQCVARGGGVYLAAADGGSPTAYVYGNGNEVAVGPQSADGQATGTGLTAEQTIAAAQAVLDALG